MTRFRSFVENHFSLVLVLSSIVGLLLPGLDQLPNESAVATLALLMFIACYKLRDGGFSTIRWRDIGLFCALRYGLLPVALWAVAYSIIPSYATAILLLATVPSAVSAPALTAIYNGAVPTAFAIAIASQLITPFMVPLQFTWLSALGLAPEGQVIPHPAHLFMTMVWCIFVPMVIYFFTRHHKRSADMFYEKGKFFAILLVAFVIALVIAKQRDVILSNLPHLGISFVIALACFSVFILFGWWFSRGQSPANRVTYTTCSGFNNVALSVSLALVHFDAAVILFVAIAELGWALLPVLLGWFLKKQTRVLP
jgi:bile acid:Na+ symporter, BASS family